MRVANIIEDGRMAGPQVRIADVACALKGRVETTVVVPKENSEAFRVRLDANGVRYHAMGLSRITKNASDALRYIAFSVGEIFRLTQYLRSERFALVHISGGAWQFKGVIAGKLAGCPVVWHLNDTSMPSFIKTVFRMLSGYADAYIFASERSRAYYGRLASVRKPQFIIPAPVDTVRFDPDIDVTGDEDLIARWAGKTVIGAVGNINWIKGFDFLIRVAAKLNQTRANLHFVIVGPVYESQRQYHEKLLLLCRQSGVTNVEFVGARADVRPLMKRFDVYACPSRAESSPIAVWEAMAMRRPIVSTDVGDVALHVEDGRSGFVVSVDDEDGFAERIGRLIDDAELRRRFGENARKAAIEDLGLMRCARQHADAYSAVIASKRR